MVFTQEQIDVVRAKVKSGTDFPREIQEFKDIGILRYEFLLESGICVYIGKNNFLLNAPTAYSTFDFLNLKISVNSSVDKLKHVLIIHQNGETNFQTFCVQAAQRGVNKWVSDLEKMTCTYYDLTGTIMLVEKIPELNN